MATLTVTITESILLNGKDQGGSYNDFTNTSITQVRKQIIKCTADAEVTLYQAADATATTGTGAAFFDEDSIKYVRITNLAATSAHGYLIVKNDQNDEFTYKLVGKQSFLLYEHGDDAINMDNAALTIGSEGNIVAVSFKPITSAQEIELFIASID